MDKQPVQMKQSNDRMGKKGNKKRGADELFSQ
jgi:hypothetical protein